MSSDSKIENLNETSMSPETLALKLDRYCTDLATSHKSDYCDLADFDIENGFDNLEKLREMREEMQQKLTDFDFDGRTDINFDSAAIAGAKVVVEERPATRSITKKLTNEVGIEEKALLYNGLPYEGIETTAAKDIHDQRTGSIVESFVDFQKQLKFKLSVLSHAIKKFEIAGKSKSAIIPDRISRRRLNNSQKGETVKSLKQRILLNVPRTPKKQRGVNPLSFNKIIDKYALEVASKVTNRESKIKRSVAPIPFDLSILDDVLLPDDNDYKDEG